MAISGIDAALTGMQPTRMFFKSATGNAVAGRPISTWGLNGIPGPGSYDTTQAGVTCNKDTPGAIFFTNPGAGLETRLARFIGAATQTGTLILVDRLWHNGGLSPSSSSLQSFNSVAFPARDNNASTNGEGVFVGLEISTATGAGTPTITVSYTNSDGVTGREGVNIVATAASTIARVFYPISLQAGDVGVRQITGYKQSTSWATGVINLVAYREIARLELSAGNVPSSLDMLNNYQRIYNDSCLQLIYVPGGSTSSLIHGSLLWTQG